MNIQRFITRPTQLSTYGRVFVNGQYYCDSQEFSMNEVTDIDNISHTLMPLEGDFKINVLFSESFNMILPAICDINDNIIAWMVDDNTMIFKGKRLLARNNNILLGFFDKTLNMRCSQSVLKMLISQMKEACFNNESINLSCSYDNEAINDWYADDLALRGFPV